MISVDEVRRVFEGIGFASLQTKVESIVEKRREYIFQ